MIRMWRVLIIMIISAFNVCLSSCNGDDNGQYYKSIIEESDDFDGLNTPLTLEAVTAGSISFKNTTSGDVKYRINGGALQTIEHGTTGNIFVLAGDKVQFIGDNTQYGKPSNSSQISCTAVCYIYGNIMSLVSSEGFSTATRLTSDYTFANLFLNTKFLASHPTKPLLLPATELTRYCYFNMFNGCTGLTLAPELPATVLAENCYSSMFNGCTGLTSAPELPATVLADYCYSSMFEHCTGLTSAPELPATTLAPHCYSYMFEDCENLTTAPALPAETLATECYSFMFEFCISLTSAPALPSTTLAAGCYSYMFHGCYNLTEAPVLPAETLVSGCYSHMFMSCIRLRSVTCLSKEAPSRKTNYWLDNVAATGTFITPAGTDWETGVSGIPLGWTRVALE